MDVGTVGQLWRYPVKSMRGEQVTDTDVLVGYGFPGDRGWAIRDEASGEIKGAKKIGALLGLAARYLDQPEGIDTPAVVIDLPDGSTVRSDDPAVVDALSAALGRPITLWPRQPEAALDHYLRVEPLDEAEIRRQLALLPSEPLPDYGARTAPEKLAELGRYVSPRGTYFDGYALHLLSGTSLASFAALVPEAAIDVRRFRPNLVVDTEADGPFPELDWVGRHVRIGTAVAKVASPMSRCVMTTLAQGDLPQDRSIMRALVRETGMDLGVALDVVEAGHVGLGDPVEVLD